MHFLQFLIFYIKVTGAALLRVVLDADGREDFSYLEACMRLVKKATSNSHKSSPVFLSSGGEDYFLSASYFDDGMFKVDSLNRVNRRSIKGQQI